jgi:hypothetical protein
MTEESEPLNVRVLLTPEQRELIRQATGEEVSALEWTPQFLEQFLAPAGRDAQGDAGGMAYVSLDADRSVMRVREMEKGHPKWTAFPRTEVRMRQEFSRAPVHARSFTRPLQRCALATCQGTCCYAGVLLNDESAAVLQRIAEEEAEFFQEIGLRLPDRVVVDAPSNGEGPPKKTAVTPRPFSTQVAGFPPHFEDTACVFLLPDARCGLQMLSEARGQHPWSYKPIPCWLHPITLSQEPQGAIVLEAEADVRSDSREFVTGAFCGRTSPCGRPAYEVLDEELGFLGQILGRDLVGEIAAGLPTASKEDRR